MTRPETIYLLSPIALGQGKFITHTLAGLHYKIYHYQNILATATKAQLGDQERQHITETVLVNFAYHIHLMETEFVNQH